MCSLTGLDIEFSTFVFTRNFTKDDKNKFTPIVGELAKKILASKKQRKRGDVFSSFNDNFIDVVDFTEK